MRTTTARLLSERMDRMDTAIQTVTVDLARVESLDDVLTECVERARRVGLTGSVRPGTAGLAILTNAIEEAADVLKLCNKARKTCEARRKEWVGPLNDHVRNYNAAVKTKLAPLVAAEQSLKDLTLAWGRTVRSIEAEAEKERQAAIRAEEARLRKIEQDRLAEEERRRVEAERRRIENLPPEPEPEPIVEADPEPIEPPAPYVPPVQTALRTRKVWTYEVVDAMAVPRQYLAVDNAKIKFDVGQGVRDIPGVKIYQKEIAITG